MLGALHDERCELEITIGDPTTTLRNYSDISFELERIAALDRKLKVYVRIEDDEQ